MIRDLDALDFGQVHDADVEVLRADRSGLDVVLDVLGERREHELIAGRARLRAHGHLFPLRRALVARVETRARRRHPDGLRRDHLVGVAADGGVARRDLQVVERCAAFVQARPEQVRAVAEKTRARDDQPDEHRKTSDPDTGRNEQHPIRRDGFRLRLVRELERVGGEQLQKRLVRIFFQERDEPLLEAAERSARPRASPGGGSRATSGIARPKLIAAAITIHARASRARGHAHRRKGERVGGDHEHDGRQQRSRREDGRSPEQGPEAQAPFEVTDIRVELLRSRHDLYGYPLTNWVIGELGD